MSGAGRRRSGPGASPSPRAAAAVLGLLLAACGGEAAPPLPAPPEPAGRPFHRGMVYGIFGRSGDAFHRENMDAMAALGVDSVQLVVPRSMRTVRDSSLSPDDPHVTPSRESLEQAVAAARARGMRLFLFPIIYVHELTDEDWRGTLAPADPEAWWVDYTVFILEEARWAASRGIEILSVGSELCSLEGETDRWRELVRQVRAVYPGLVTYSANWDHLDVMAFADALDLLGMNAYFEVGRDRPGDARAEAPTVAGLAARWEPILDGVERWSRRHGKPVLVTEVGYPSRAGATLDPWNHLGEGAVDVAAQEQGYRAFILAWSRRPWLAGVYFYLWWDDPAEGGRGYTPRGKPAAGTLRRWYTQGQP